MEPAACPKCGHRPPAPLGPMEACPACGVYPHKLPPPASAPPTTPLPESLDLSHGDWSLPKDESDPLELGLRAALLALLAVWGLRLAAMDLASGEIGGSFMHNINLVIHEAGHVFFRILGEFMGVAGGSLFQVLFPAGIGVAFLVKNRDPYGAAVCLWWAGVSLMDVAPYIYDALDPRLILLGGSTGEDGPHDWIYLFGRLGGLRHSQGWGRFVHLLGLGVMLGAIAWGGGVLWRRWRKDRA